MSTLLDRIKELMNDRQINARQLTSELGISSSSLTDWNKGKSSPSLDAVIKISDYFDVSIDYLVHGKNTPTIRELDSSVHNLDFSNHLDIDLLKKFHQLTPDLQEKLLAYADGMLVAMPRQQTSSEKRLSV